MVTSGEWKGKVMVFMQLIVVNRGINSECLIHGGLMMLDLYS